MGKKSRWILVVLSVEVCVYLVGIVMDKQELQDKVIRLHVVGASDSDRDQMLKLQVRDAVLERMETVLAGVTNKEQALGMIRGMADELSLTADQVLAKAGTEDRVTVSVGEVSFPRRDYDTFSLPAGVYDALKITIGEGQGRNWWCVVFPALCRPAATGQVDAVAAGAGFSRGNRGALTGEYEVRFYLLDLLGRMENFFRSK
jgi:stage II sporulation protein R